MVNIDLGKNHQLVLNWGEEKFDGEWNIYMILKHLPIDLLLIARTKNNTYIMEKQNINMIIIKEEGPLYVEEHKITFVTF